MYRLFLLLVLASTYSPTYSARILGVFPMPSLSHQVVFRALYSELVKRGHELVVVTTDPMYKNKTPPENLTEIDIGYFYELMTNRSYTIWRDLKRGVITVANDWLELDTDFIVKKVGGVLNCSMSEIIKNKNEKFDLILFQTFSYLPLVFCEIFQAPAIMVSSFHGLPEDFATIGAVTRHPILYPHNTRDKFGNLNLFEKIYELYMEYEFYKKEQRVEKAENEYLNKHFGSVPPMKDLKKYVQLFFVNCHPLFDGNRPVPPGVVYLGAMHLKPIKKLPQDLKSYLDSSKRGVIYVSLGTNVRTQYMDSEMMNAFLDAFEALPYDILWKFDNDGLERIPKNVKMQKWFPQRDLLGHPNIKLFITQGGLQSTDEAIDARVPLIGIPCFSEQRYNVHKYVEFGIGVKIEAFTLTASDVIKAVNTVLSVESYRENIHRLHNIVKDQKETAVERAVWWTEYVLRHKNSRHLLSRAADMSWSEYLMADVVLTLTMILLISGIICLAVYKIIRIFVNQIVKLKKD